MEAIVTRQMHRAEASLIALVLAGIGFAALAQTPATTVVTPERPWARATPAGAKTGVIYMTVINSSTSIERLLGASTPVAESVQFHNASEENGIVRMHELRTIEIAPAGKIVLQPGGMHVMLVGLKQPLKEGQTFPLTLRFERSGQVEIAVPVERIGASAPGVSRVHH